MGKPIKQIRSRAIPLRGDDIDTDRIIPARFLKCVTFDGLGEHAFEDDRRDASGKPTSHPFNNPVFQDAGILVVNKNFGCGSSREHAPQALQRYGIQAILGESFAGIFFGNCVSLGIPCLTMTKDDIHALQDRIAENPETGCSIDLNDLSLKTPDSTWKLNLPESIREQFVSGNWDVTALLLENSETVQSIADSLPYLRWSNG